MSKASREKRRLSGILLLDKPLGMSSNAALQQARRLFRAEKAGHTGSLDPLATGLLPICFGQATKLCGYLLDSDKRYTATAKLGEKTTTGDAEGEIVARSPCEGLSREALEAALPRFLGPIAQVPPMYSALKREGRRLYELAREGQEVERTPREVTIHALRLLDFGEGCLTLDVRCSKGTYIRTLVEDIAAALGQYAHLTALRRTEVAPFDAQRMVSLEALGTSAASDPAALDRWLLPPVTALDGWPRIRLDAERAHYLSQGQAVRVAGAPAKGELAVLDEAGTLLCIAAIDPEGRVAPRRWLADAAE